MQLELIYLSLVALVPVVVGSALGGIITELLFQIRDEFVSNLNRLLGISVGGLIGLIYDLLVMFPALLSGL